MNNRFHANQPISLFGSVFRLLIVFFLCLTAKAVDQLAPNPNHSTITVIETTENSEHFDNYGIIENLDLINNGSIINNEGTINNKVNLWNNILGVFFGTIDNSGSINNSGTIYNGIFSNINNSGSIWNLGIIYNGAGSTIDNSGTFDNTAGTFNNFGIFKGTGTFVGTLDTSSGTVAPGSSAGTMFVQGDYVLDDPGILDIEIGGFTPGTFDLLDITGTAFLPGGNINFSFLSGYDIASQISPGQSMMLQFLKAGDIDSFSSGITYDFLGSPQGFRYDVFQQGSGLYFEATNTTIPAPGAIVLGSIGVSLVGWLRRRRTL